jgi:hypothetical protein
MFKLKIIKERNYSFLIIIKKNIINNSLLNKAVLKAENKLLINSLYFSFNTLIFNYR